MKTLLIKKTIFILALFVFLPSLVLAHQPRITESRTTQVPDPEISKAYYGTLTGEPDIYVVDATEPFNLYVNILVPDIDKQKKDVSGVILRNDEQIVVLDGVNFDWKQFYEPFGADSYFVGPEYEAQVEAGRYEIRIWSSNNDSKYSLAIGNIEAFDFKEVLNALTLIPQLKNNFFEESPIGFIVSPFGWGLIVIMYSLAFAFGLVYRAIVKRLAPRALYGSPKNIGARDRWLRIAIGLILLVWAISTTWNPILIFFSGFSFFEAVFGWCGFYAIFGKNTCSIK